MGRWFWMILLGMMALAPTPAHAWWDTAWKFRKQVVLDTTPAGVNMAGAVGRTVVLVRLTDGNFTFSEALENGADLRFVDADDKTPLPHHIESFDPTTGIATVWVSVPNLSGGEKRAAWMYFGNAEAGAVTSTADTFDADHALVYHFSEGAGRIAADKTANRNDSVTPPAGLNPGGIIGQSARFPGSGGIRVAASPSLTFAAGTPFTFSAWVRPGNLTGEQAIFAGGQVLIGHSAGTPFVAFGPARASASAALRANDWNHLAVTADATSVRIYVNGVEAGAAAAASPGIGGELLFGGTADRPFTGELDEVRLSKVARPANMLLAMASAEGPGGKLVSIAEQAEEQGGHGGTFFYVLSKVEFVDQIIIGLCMLLLGLAIAVMVAKSRYLGASNKANAQFMKRFNELDENLVSLKTRRDISPEEIAYLQKSQLYRIYETGISELEIRRASRGSKPLSSEAVEAMRSSVDAVVVEENQKLDTWMVLLTIAISGGPFIGLLGTVLGVMNTFGGVALAGDVNVNAIAPGIAAALMATIAGLAAAIPSLFGYNYLNTQITKLSDTMRVFVDRLVTRLAEMQSDSAPPPMAMAAE